MPTRRLDIYLGPAGVNCKIALDGKPVENCRSVAILANVGEATRVQLELINIAAYIHADELLDANVECLDVTPLTTDKRKYILAQQAETNEDLMRLEDNGGKPS